MITSSQFTLAHQIKCVEHAIASLQRASPTRRVNDALLSQAQADYQIACMRAVLKTLQSLIEKGERD